MSEKSEVRVLCDGGSVAFDGMVWPCPGERLEHLERLCRGYGGELDERDRMTLASIVNAYCELVTQPVRRSRYAVSRIREGAKQHREASGG